MKIKDIKVGRWYETTAGTGLVEVVGGTHPPSIKIKIVAPFPRGSIYLKPRDIHKEVTPPATHPSF